MSEYKGQRGIKALEASLLESISRAKEASKAYNGKLRQFETVAEEWNYLSGKAEALPDKALWSFEASMKHANRSAMGAVAATAQKLRENHSDMEIYNAVQPALDDAGYSIFLAAQEITGINVYNVYGSGDMMLSEVSSGFEDLRLVEAAKFGERRYEQEAPYEFLSGYRIDTNSSQFTEYQSQLYTRALDKVMKSHHSDLDKNLSALSSLQNISRQEISPSLFPSQNWVSMVLE